MYDDIQKILKLAYFGYISAYLTGFIKFLILIIIDNQILLCSILRLDTPPSGNLIIL